MKRCLCAVLAVVTLLAFSACGKKESSDENGFSDDKHHEMILEAIDVLMNAWEDIYSQDSAESDGCVQIRNKRLKTLKENTNAYFKDVAHIVEFVVFSDYLGSAPYYMNANFMDSVVIYKDGTMEV